MFHTTIITALISFLFTIPKALQTYVIHKEKNVIDLFSALVACKKFFWSFS